MTCVDFLRKHFPGSTEQEYRAHLGRYGLTGDLGLNEISTLSGGQKVSFFFFFFFFFVFSFYFFWKLFFLKSRLVFAWMSFTNPHLMVLDEPENHLDVDTVDALAVVSFFSRDLQFLIILGFRLWTITTEQWWLCRTTSVSFHCASTNFGLLTAERFALFFCVAFLLFF